MTKPTLDAIDKLLIRELQIDGRKPYTQLAKVAGLSEAAIRQRVQRLIDGQVMQVVAVTDPLSLGAVRIGPQRIVESTERMVSVLGLDGCGDPGRNPEVAMGIVLGVIVAVLVAIYLLVALLRPERF